MRTVALACQGGGSHTAFTGGVLQRLLADQNHRVVALSGTSGGAVCALLAWDGLLTGGAAPARGRRGRPWGGTPAAPPGGTSREPVLGGAGPGGGALLGGPRCDLAEGQSGERWAGGSARVGGAGGAADGEPLRLPGCGRPRLPRPADPPCGRRPAGPVAGVPAGGPAASAPR